MDRKEVLQKYPHENTSRSVVNYKISPQIEIGCLTDHKMDDWYSIGITFGESRKHVTFYESRLPGTTDKKYWTIIYRDEYVKVLNKEGDIFEIETDELTTEVFLDIAIVKTDVMTLGDTERIKFREEVEAPQEILDIFPILPLKRIRDIPTQPHGISFVDLKVETI